MSFHLLYADPHILVLDKPSGLLAVPGRGPDGRDCLSARVQARFPEARIIHRLDMDTSGLLIMARNPPSHRLLSMAFATRQVRKRYIAIVAGCPPSPGRADGWGLIDLPLIVDWPNRPRSIVDPVRGKPSQTRWRVLSVRLLGGGPTSRLELEPITGRTHQLRVHLQALGHPILGDRLYAPDAVRQAAPRLLLHASGLTLAHPVTRKDLYFESPADF
ncbi:MAG TPA: pseudouridine synthase [Thiobacillaceae bacterium]|nr:pseudouridine synthase [Thiobacillaceae bacterium]HNU65307.1 pseudouridine synthase [Thiobacillaceae bacterium]